MSGHNGYLRRYAKEERTVQETRFKGLSQPQRMTLARASADEWMTAKQLETTSSACKNLAKRGLLLASVIDGEMVYKLGKAAR